MSDDDLPGGARLEPLHAEPRELIGVSRQRLTNVVNAVLYLHNNLRVSPRGR